MITNTPFFNGFKTGFLYVIVRADLPMYVALFLYYFINALQEQFLLGRTGGGAHSMSWTFVFAFALYVRLTIPYVIKSFDKIGSWKHKIKNAFLANRELLLNMLESGLVACFAIGTIEFMWDVSFFIHSIQVSFFHLDLITMFEVSAIIGMSLSGTGMAIGLIMIRNKYFDNRKLLIGLSLYTLLFIFWIAIGFPYTASGNQWENNLFVNVLETYGHWGGGVSVFAYAYKRPKK